MDNLMFSTPTNGWTHFNVTKYCPNIPEKYKNLFYASYICPTAKVMFEMLLDMFNPKIHHLGAVQFDAEGYYWYLMENENGFSLLLDNLEVEPPKNENDALINTFVGFELLGSLLNFAQDWVDCYESCKEEWLAFDLCEMSADSITKLGVEEHLRQFSTNTGENFSEKEIQDILNRIETTRNELELLNLQLKNFIKEKSNK